MKALIISAVTLCASLCVTTVPMAAQQTQAEAKKPGKPAPRLPDGHIDLGNGAGVWDVKRIEDMSGNGGGEQPGEALKRKQLLVLDAQVQVAFLPWAKKAYDQAQATI